MKKRKKRPAKPNRAKRATGGFANFRRSRDAKKSPSRRRTSKRYASTGPSIAIIKGGAILWKIPRRLRSLNSLKTGIARYGDTKAWENHFLKAELKEDDGSFQIGQTARHKLEIQRLSPNRRYFLDSTNLHGAAKGLEDALVRLGYLVDDSEMWEDGPHVSQALSPDKRYWTIIKLSIAEQGIKNAEPLWSANQTHRGILAQRRAS